MKKLIASVLAATMLTGAGLAAAVGAETENTAMKTAQAETTERVLWTNGEDQLTETDIQLLNGGSAKIHTRDGRTVFVEGNCSREPVKDMAAAGKVVRSMLMMMGGDPGTELEPWREIRDPVGNRYFIFQQMQGDVTVMGGAVKVITDAEGQMLGMTASLVTALPDVEWQEGITAEAAEALVLGQEDIGAGTELVAGKTRKIVLPMTLELDPDAEEEDENSRYVWAVYTVDPENKTDMPYLAHYVTTQGEYLYSMPAVLPGDRASTAGYPAEYAFDHMEPASYTGYVDLADGTEKEITVTLMRDTLSGMYYLGNIERKIAVADCWEFLYNGGRVDMVSSADNREWEQKALMSLYNYCRAYDYFRDIGWSGADGLDTPILILNNFCDREHRPVNNAAFAGQYYGWQIFLSSRANDMAQCLDVLAHEYTHCVTRATMTWNDYLNDQGAINEAISDIQGNICEQMYDAAAEKEWEIGEDALNPFRSMSDPHRYGQPEHTWDLYYDDHVAVGTAMNDRGGVHTNSSLLNRVAWMLCEEGGMRLSDARAFWFAADCAMTPGTDYSQLAEILPFVLRNMGMNSCEATLAKALEATRLGETEAPEDIRAGQTMLKLRLPDIEAFMDGNWSMGVLTLNTDALKDRIFRIALKTALGDTEDLPEMVRDIAGYIMRYRGEHEEISLAGMAMDLLFGDNDGETSSAAAEAAEDIDAYVDEAYDWFVEQVRGVFYSDMGAAGEDGRTIRMICAPGYTIPYLTYLTLEDNSDQISRLHVAVWVHNRWVDISGIVNSVMGTSDRDLLTAVMYSGLADALINALIDAGTIGDLTKELILHTRSGEIVELSAAGLEGMALDENMAAMMQMPADGEAEELPVAMSRPKG